MVTRNPIRYRGYYYDQDTKLYYLNARYYSPEWRRFISPDDTAYLDPETPNGLNLYVYCGNNPVMNTDPNGTFMLSSFLLGLGIAAAIGAGVGAVSYVASEAISFVITGEWTWSWGMFAGSVLGGAIGGAISFLFPGIGLTGGAFITGVLSTSIGMGLENAFGEANHSIGNIIFNSLLNGVLSAGFAKLTSLIKIPKFTGRGSISQVARQMNTKFYRGRKVGHIKLKTFMKLGAYESAYSVFTTIVSGLLDAFEYFRNIDKYAIPGQFPGIQPETFPYTPLYP